MFMVSKTACYMAIDTLLPFTYSSLRQCVLMLLLLMDMVRLGPRVTLVDYLPLSHVAGSSQVTQSGSTCFLLKEEKLTEIVILRKFTRKERKKKWPDLSDKPLDQFILQGQAILYQKINWELRLIVPGRRVRV